MILPLSVNAVPETAADLDDQGPEARAESTVRVLPDRDPLALRITRAELDLAAKFYGRGFRQLRRWLSIGREKGDPCPLFKPGKMPGWWARCMSHNVPNDIFVLAVGANGNCAPPAACGAVPSEPPPEPVDLKTIDFNECDSVRQLRGLAQAVYKQLADAYLKRACDIPILQRRYQQALEALRKEEAADRQARREAGDLIPRGQMERDAATVAEMLRASRVSMTRRVLELCPNLNPPDKAAVAEAIERVRAHEDRIFQRLNRLSSADEFLSELSGSV